MRWPDRRKTFPIPYLPMATRHAHCPLSERRIELRWYACYTRPRHEKQVGQRLVRQGIESYVPLIPQLRRWSDRNKTVSVPMFPGYVFGRFALRDLHDVLLTHGVVMVVQTGDHPAPLSDHEIENARRLSEVLSAGGLEVDTEPYVEQGQRVAIVDGPFHGLEGIVIERRGRRRVLVGIKTIGQAVALDLHADVLKPVMPRDSLHQTGALQEADDSDFRRETTFCRVSRARSA
jgi:transcription antitermination factor NusG